MKVYQNYLENSANIYLNDINVDKLNDNLIKTIKESACNSDMLIISKVSSSNRGKQIQTLVLKWVFSNKKKNANIV